MTTSRQDPSETTAGRHVRLRAQSRDAERAADMALGMYFTPSWFTPERYDGAITRLEAAGAGAPAGRLYHIALETEGQIQVSDVWDSEESFQAFGATLVPILAMLGVDLARSQHHRGLGVTWPRTRARRCPAPAGLSRGRRCSPLLPARPARYPRTCTARILDRVVDLHSGRQAGHGDGQLGGCCSRSATCWPAGYSAWLSCCSAATGRQWPKCWCCGGSRESRSPQSGHRARRCGRGRKNRRSRGWDKRRTRT